MKRIDVMVDIETLGTESNSTIFQIAAAAFDINTGQIGAQFDETADISKNKTYEMVVSGSTLMWWASNPELFKKLLNQGSWSSIELVERFRKWLGYLDASGYVLYLWGNGILFDNAMLKEQMGDDYPIHFRNDRDVRTIVDMTCQKLDVTEKELRERTYDMSLDAHNAYNDVVNQVRMVTTCWAILMDKTQEDRKMKREEFNKLLEPVDDEDEDEKLK